MSRRRYFEEQRSGKGGGGYGGGGGVRYSMVYAGAGGDGTVLIRGRRYKS